eukprot:scaffold31886_cov101-Isochrysis_galbana.AAC.1
MARPAPEIARSGYSPLPESAPSPWRACVCVCVCIPRLCKASLNLGHDLRRSGQQVGGHPVLAPHELGVGGGGVEGRRHGGQADGVGDTGGGGRPVQRAGVGQLCEHLGRALAGGGGGEEGADVAGVVAVVAQLTHVGW